MWAVIKLNNNNIGLFKNDLKKKIGQDFKLYSPKLSIQKFKKNKLTKVDLNLLGNYIFFFHKDIKNKNLQNILKFTRGAKFVLNGFIESQDELVKFISKCKSSENENGFISENFFDFDLFKSYRFSSGPFTNEIFKILCIQKNKLKVLIGEIKTTINRKEFLYSPTI